MNTASKIIFFCDLEHVGRNYFAVVVLIFRKIRLISHNSGEIILVFYFTYCLKNNFRNFHIAFLSRCYYKMPQ